MNDRVSGGQAELTGDDIKSLEKLSESYKACLLYTSPSPRDRG